MIQEQLEQELVNHESDNILKAVETAGASTLRFSDEFWSNESHTNGLF